MSDPGSARQLNGHVRSNPTGSVWSDGHWTKAMPDNGLIRFNPFHMEGRNRRVGAKSEVRVDE